LDFSPSVERIFCVHLVPKEKSDRNCKKKRSRGKNFCFPGLTTAMLGLTTAAFYLETGKKCRLSGPIVAAALGPQFCPRERRQ
jgi:hypothetical protein